MPASAAGPMPRWSALRAFTALVRADLRARWNGGLLTWAWAVIQPTALIAVFAVVFGLVMVQRTAQFPSAGAYLAHVCVGVFLWNGFSDALIRGSQAIADGATIIRGRGIPLAWLPLRSVCAAWVLAGIGLAGCLAILPACGVKPGVTWLLTPLPVLALILTSAGFALACAGLAVLARDTAQILGMLLPVLFWSAPIVYAPSMLPEWAQPWLLAHPFAPGLMAVHELLVQRSLPSAGVSLSTLAMACGPLIIGAVVLRRLGPVVRDVL